MTTETTNADLSTVSTQVSDASAPSSSAEGSTPPRSLMDAIKAVVDVGEEPDVLDAGEKPPAEGSDGSGETPAPADATANEASTQDTRQEDVLDGPLTQEERKQLSGRTAKRIDKLLEQRSALTHRLEELSDVERVVHEVGISKSDLGILVNIGASLQKGDFDGFLRQITPYYRVAMEATGRALPTDLKKKVDDGLLDTDAAAEVSRSRYRAQLAENRAMSVQRQREAEYQDQAVTAIRSNADAWEDQVRQRDPDYDKKAEAIKVQAKALIHEFGYPSNPQVAIQYADEAYRRVNEMFGNVRPKMQPTRPSPSGLSSSSTSAMPKPSNVMEAAMLGLRKARS